MIQVDGVSRSFGDVHALIRVSMEVKPGEVVGLLGPSGAGKTTLVRIMAGSEVAASDKVVVGGVEMPDLSALARIGYMPQSDALYLELSGFENLQFIGALYGLSGDALKHRIKVVGDMVGMTADLVRPVHQYSGGMRRRLSLAASFLHEPRVLLLDEPTVGIDPILRQSLWREFHRQADAGAAILVTTHVMDEAEKCDRVAMLRAGHLLEVSTPIELVRDAGVETLEEAFLHLGGVDVAALGAAQ